MEMRILAIKCSEPLNLGPKIDSEKKIIRIPKTKAIEDMKIKVIKYIPFKCSKEYLIFPLFALK